MFNQKYGDRKLDSNTAWSLSLSARVMENMKLERIHVPSGIDMLTTMVFNTDNLVNGKYWKDEELTTSGAKH
jgi:hypothetical protein